MRHIVAREKKHKMERIYIPYDIHINAYFTNFGVTLILQTGPMDKVSFLTVVVSLQSRKNQTNKQKNKSVVNFHILRQVMVPGRRV